MIPKLPPLLSETQHRVLTNTVLRLGTRGIGIVSSALIAALVGREWGVDALGFYASVTVLGISLSFLFEYGLSELLLREMVQYPSQARELLSRACALLVLGFLPATVVATTMTLSVVGGGMSTATAALAVSMWLAAGGINASLTAVFFANERMGLDTRAILVERMLSVLLAIPVVFQTESIALLIAVTALARWVTVAINAATVRPLVGLPLPRFEPAAMRNMMREAAPFWIHMLFTNLYFQQGVLMLTLLASSYEVGLYRSASLFYNQMPIIAVAFNGALFPRLMREWHGGHRDRFSNVLRLSVTGTVMAGLGIAAALMLVAEPLTIMLYGQDFRPAISALRVLSLGLPFAFLNNSLGMGLTVLNRQHIRASITVAGAVLSVALNLLLIPRYGLIGAAIAAPIVEGGMVLALAVACVRVGVFRTCKASAQPPTSCESNRPMGAVIVEDRG